MKPKTIRQILEELYRQGILDLGRPTYDERNKHIDQAIKEISEVILSKKFPTDFRRLSREEEIYNGIIDIIVNTINGGADE